MRSCGTRGDRAVIADPAGRQVPLPVLRSEAQRAHLASAGGRRLQRMKRYRGSAPDWLARRLAATCNGARYCGLSAG
jgi:hypothetical protein